MSQDNSDNAPLSTEDIAYVGGQIRSAGLYVEEALKDLERLEVIDKELGDFVTSVEVKIASLLAVALRRRFSPKVYGVITEEDNKLPPDRVDRAAPTKKRILLVDPLDGTDNYCDKRDGQYCIMVGLLMAQQPAFGWIHAPARDTLYFGGPGYGCFRQRDQGKAEPLSLVTSRPEGEAVRIIMGSRDPNRTLVEKAFEKIEWVKMGSLGLKVIHIIEGHADLYLHLVRELKVWDTIAPVALALAAGLKVCSLEGAPLRFDIERPQHDQAIIIGRANWVDEAIRRLGPCLTTS